MDEEKVVATASPENILPLNDRRGKITSPKDIYKINLTKEIKETEQSPLRFNIPPILFKGSGLLLIPQPPLNRRVKKIMAF